MTPTTVSESIQARVRAVREQLGEARACEQLQLNRASFARILAGLPVRAGTVALLERNLERLDAATPVSAP